VGISLIQFTVIVTAAVLDNDGDKLSLFLYVNDVVPQKFAVGTNVNHQPIFKFNEPLGVVVTSEVCKTPVFANNLVTIGS
jgi:hypothetical protein